VSAAEFKTTFPYLNTPLPGAPFEVAPPDGGGM
jgi:hypothetical protein